MPHRLHPRKPLGSVALVLFIGLVAWVTLVIYAFRVGTTERSQLCAVLYSMIQGSGAQIGKPGSPGYDYYRHHPRELARARQQNRAFLNALPCGNPRT